MLKGVCMKFRLSFFFPNAKELYVCCSQLRLTRTKNLFIRNVSKWSCWKNVEYSIEIVLLNTPVWENQLTALTIHKSASKFYNHQWEHWHRQQIRKSEIKKWKDRFSFQRHRSIPRIKKREFESLHARASRMSQIIQLADDCARITFLCLCHSAKNLACANHFERFRKQAPQCLVSPSIKLKLEFS